MRWSPYIYFKWGTEGYELGLEVNADWWKDICAADATNQLGKIKTHPEFLTGTTRLLVATLPYSEFGVYSAGNAPASWFATSKQKHRDKELTNAGWKREESDWEMHHLGAPESVKHKYFTVSHRAI